MEEPFVRAGEMGTVFYFCFFPVLGAVQRYEDFVIRRIRNVGDKAREYDWIDPAFRWDEREWDEEN